MNTSESSTRDPHPAGPDPTPGSFGPDTGLPDETSLTRLANEIFSSPPRSPASVLPGMPAPTYGVPDDVSLVRFQHEAVLFAAVAPAGLFPGVPQSPVVAPPQTLVPDLPLNARPPGGTAPHLADVPLPYEAEIRALLATSATKPDADQEMELLPDIPLDGTPSSAGLVSHPSAASATVTLPYDAELRSLRDEASWGGRGLDPSTGAGSSLYFLKHLGGAHPYGDGGIRSPGAHTPDIRPDVASGDPPFDVHAIRRDFPILSEHVNGRPLVWLDNAATTHKPRAVIDRLVHFYEHESSNIHRAAHELAARATDAYEGARRKVQRFINAPSPGEIVFTRGTTESINLVAATFGAKHVTEGDEIVITHLEHHANIVPWQQLALAKGAKLRVAPVDDRGVVLLDEYGKLLNRRTKLVAFTQVSNALGTVTPARQMAAMAKEVGARVLLDGAQSVSHMNVDVQDLGCDFFVFSGHKLFGPTGIGVLWGKQDLLDGLPPYQTGGNMIQDVTFERSIFLNAPNRFEAGTGNIADAVGLGAAIDYVERIGLHNIAAYEHCLIAYATRRLLEDVPGIRIIGTSPEKAGAISLVLKGIPSEEVGARLNKYGIAVRSGHHCAQPILRRFGQETTVRPSFAFYNTRGEIDFLVGALREIQSESGLSFL